MEDIQIGDKVIDIIIKASITMVSDLDVISGFGIDDILIDTMTSTHYICIQRRDPHGGWILLQGKVDTGAKASHINHDIDRKFFGHRSMLRLYNINLEGHI